MRESPTNFAESVELVRRLQARETADPLINSECHSVLFEHGDAARRAIVFLHGITSSPIQFRDLAARFHARGYNVLIPRMPRHGYTDRLSRDHARLRPADSIEFASGAVEIGRYVQDEPPFRAVADDPASLQDLLGAGNGRSAPLFDTELPSALPSEDEEVVGPGGYAAMNARHRAQGHHTPLTARPEPPE